MALNYTPAPNQSLNYTPVPEKEESPSVSFPSGGQSTPLNYTPAPNYTPVPKEEKRSEFKEDSGGFDASSSLSDMGYSNKNEFRDATGYSSVEKYLNDQRNAERDRADAQSRKAQEIGGAFDPIFSELDRQLSGLSGRQRDFESQINRSTVDQLSAVDANTSSSVETLEGERSRGLRDLEEDIRNQMTASNRIIGAAGAGASSAVGQASEAVARIGQRARSDLNQNAATQLKSIEELSLKQKNDINTWKQDKLFEISDFFAKQLDALTLQKAGASRDKKNSIAQLEFQIEQDYINQLRGLDQQTLQYNQSVDKWQQDRTQKLSAFDQSLNTARDTGIQGMMEAAELFNTLVKNGFDEESAEAILAAEGIVRPQGFTPEDENNPYGVFGLPTQAAVESVQPQQVQQVDPFAGLFEEF